MLKYFVPLLLFGGCQFESPSPVASSSPRYYKAELTKCNGGIMLDGGMVYGRLDDGKQYYTIAPNISDASAAKTASQVDTLQLIGDLLLFKGDTRICMKPVVCQNIESSKIYKSQDYSIQVDALFKINQLFRKDYYRYSPAPVLMDNNTEIRECIDGDIVDRAYRAYTVWFSQVRKIGLNQARKRRIMPLEGSTVSWY